MRKPIMLLENFETTDLDELKRLGKKVVFLDADNTLFIPNVPLNEQGLETIVDKLTELKEQFTIIIISNNFSQDKDDFFQKLNIPTIFFAKKPLPINFKKAHKLAESLADDTVKKNDIIHIGDQFLTDGIGSIWYQIDYILVNPINEEKDLIYAKPSRLLERLFKIRETK